jgi:hypothetical protein
MPVTSDEQVVIRSFNPHRARGLKRTVLTRPALEILKALRAQGYRVRADPNEGERIEFLTTKGALDFFRDPVILLTLSVPIGVLTSIIGNWLYNRTRRQHQVVDSVSIAIELSESGHSLRYDHAGREISERRFRDVLGMMQARQHYFDTLASRNSPFPDKPWPICLEHSDRVVGWARLRETREGLNVEPGIITDSETWHRIRSGQLRGISFSGVVAEARCSVCEGDYTACEHHAGQRYGQVECVSHLAQIDLCEVSVVETPANPECLVTLEWSNDEGDA